jgi:hypothetical protein
MNLHLGQQVSASYDESPPHTISLRFAREDSILRELPLIPTGAWATTRGASLGRKRLHHDVWATDSPHHASAPAGGLRKQLAPTRALMQVCSAAQPSHHHPTPLHASFARGTQAPPTTSSSLRLGLNVVG